VDEVGAGRVAGVAVVPRIGDEHAVAVEQPEVDAPRVDADARRRLRFPSGGGAQPLEDLAVQPQDVPVEAVGQSDRLVGEAVDLVEAQLTRATRPTMTRPLDAPISTATTEPEAELAAELTDPTAGQAARRSRRS
jgi:hypothetical protein